MLLQLVHVVAEDIADRLLVQAGIFSNAGKGGRTRGLPALAGGKLQHAHLALEHFRNASKEQRDQDARRHEQQVQQLQAETRHANQALIVKQGEITQLNKEGARLVAELAASAKSVRSLTAQADQARAALSQAYIDQARIEAERDGLRSTAQQQADALAAERAERERLTRELAGVTARLDAQEQVLAGYRAQLGVAGPAT